MSVSQSSPRFSHCVPAMCLPIRSCNRLGNTPRPGLQPVGEGESVGWSEERVVMPRPLHALEPEEVLRAGSFDERYLNDTETWPFYNGERNRLFLAVTASSHGPVTAKEVHELEMTLKDCTATRPYGSAFPGFRRSTDILTRRPGRRRSGSPRFQITSATSTETIVSGLERMRFRDSERHLIPNGIGRTTHNNRVEGVARSGKCFYLEYS